MTQPHPTPGNDSRAALEALVAARRGALVRLARRIVGDAHQAEDVVQETLIAVYRKLDHQPPRHLDAYVRRAVELNALKHRLRRRTSVPLDAIAEPVDDVLPPDDWLDLDPAALEQALTGLPVNQQTVLRLRFYMNLSFQEIADQLRISINTAGSRCRYALTSLRKTLSSQDESPQPAQDSNQPLIQPRELPHARPSHP